MRRPPAETPESPLAAPFLFVGRDRPSVPPADETAPPQKLHSLAKQMIENEGMFTFHGRPGLGIDFASCGDMLQAIFLGAHVDTNCLGCLQAAIRLFGHANLLSRKTNEHR
jgi:hypothetical protein